MTAMFTKNVVDRPYTGSSPYAGRATRVTTMPNVTSIVFVVDDDVSVRESLELLVSTAGWQPETFASAPEFLSRARATVPCCLVLDVTLPGLNGLELQGQLAERTETGRFVEACSLRALWSACSSPSAKRPCSTHSTRRFA